LYQGGFFMGYRFKLIGADAGALENPAVVGRGGFELRGNAGGFPGQNEKRGVESIGLEAE